MALPPLYKYLDVKGADLTLGNRTFNFAKPSDFNDTEDLTIESIFPEDVDAAVAKLANGFPDVILDNINVPPTGPPGRRYKVALLQYMYRIDPKAADAVKKEIREDPTRKVLDVEYMRTRCQLFLEEINEFMQSYRVLCVTTLKDSDRMWTGYAQDHKGIVLRIEPCVEKDSKFQLFRPVQYRTSRPPLYDDTLDFLKGSLFGDQGERNRAMLEKMVYAKTLMWQHESEYRLAIPLPKDENWNTLRYHPEEITELYLGLAITKENKEKIVAKGKKVNPKITIFQASRGATRTVVFQKL